ncbi:452_t:CDS:2, partial [Acaulospora colombiana]
MKVIATWIETEDYIKLSLWSIIEGEEKLKVDKEYEDFRLNYKLYPKEADEFSYPRLAISDSKHLVLHLKNPHKNNKYNIDVYNLKTKKQNKLNAPDFEGEMDSWNFVENDDFVVVKGKPVYRAYIFSNDNIDTDKWNCKRVIELQYFAWSYIDFNGKLFLTIDSTLILTQWSLKELILEQQYMLETPKRCRIVQNSNATLLVIQESEISFIYSMELGMRLSRVEEPDSMIYFIGPNIGERIIIISTWGGNCKIINPYSPYSRGNLRDATELLESAKINIDRPYVIKYDKIIGLDVQSEEQEKSSPLCIRPLIESNWIKHLRDKLGDCDTFGSPYEATRVKEEVKRAKEIIQETVKSGRMIEERVDYTSREAIPAIKIKGALLEWDLRVDIDYDGDYLKL